MTDWTRIAIERLDTLTDLVWDVVPRSFTALDVRVCRAYDTAALAYETLLKAGYEPAAGFVASRPLAAAYDLTTLMKFVPAGEDTLTHGVILARRLPHGPAGDRPPATSRDPAAVTANASKSASRRAPV